MSVHEVNFDGLIGPTHNYAGLALGNIASAKYAASIANPKAAAIQGLGKMQLLMQLGLKQAVLPPHERPDLKWLKRLGFTGSPEQIIDKVYRTDPNLLAACYSASSMWVANAATVSPSIDTQDHRVHLTPANLSSCFHRHQEAKLTRKILAKIFHDDRYFMVHDYLPCSDEFADEGAANHLRLCPSHNKAGIEIFVYGRQGFRRGIRPTPKRFPARQTYDACRAVSRLHGLSPAKLMFVQQNPDAIDQGVFHNDIIALSHQQILFFHELSFHKANQVIAELEKKVDFQIDLIQVSAQELSITDVVKSYLFNSQLITTPNQDNLLIAPIECRYNKKVSQYIEKLIAGDNPIKQVKFVDIRESMHNGGGPACLRLRIVLTLAQLQAIHQGVLLTEVLYQQLINWVQRYYRDRLAVDDLRDPQLMKENQEALEQLTKLLKLNAIYSFQQ